MTSPSTTRHYASAGFYLPSFPSSFFSEEQDRPYLDLSYSFDTGYGPFKEEDVRLDTTIFARLLMVLPRKGFTSAHPVFPEPKPKTLDDVSQSPTAIVILLRDVEEAIKKLQPKDSKTDQAELTSDSVSHLTPLSHAGVQSLALVVDHDGYFVWIATHAGRSANEEQVRVAIKAHIEQLVGGDFSSHKPGPGVIAAQSDNYQPDPSDPSLTTYTIQHKGMLTFTQLNTVLEGLRNLNLDPRVFFHNETAIERDYTIGAFFGHITAVFHPAKKPPKARRERAAHGKKTSEEARAQQIAQDQDDESNAQGVIDGFFNYFYEDDTRFGQSEGMSRVHDFADVCLNRNACEHLLNRFLSRTEVISLKPIKGWIERCRRALIDELIEVTHRRIPLVQAQPPDGPADRIEDVTEAQLRGYVMFLSAKLPLISNVLLHLEDLHYEIVSARNQRRHDHARQEEERFADPESSTVFGPFNSWRGLLRAIQADLQSLSDAINQARTDRMLYEQEQIHAEQETLAEIERLNDRSARASGSGSSGVVNVIANFLAFLAVVLATGPFIKNGRLNFSPVGLIALINGSNLPGVEAIGILLVALGFIYFVIHFVAENAVQWIGRRIRREARREAKYYYEMDIHTDAPFRAQAIPEIITSGECEKLQPSRTLDEYYQWRRDNPDAAADMDGPGVTTETLTRRTPIDYKKVVRNSYRVERQEKTEALHKIYVEADIKVSSLRHMHAVLVYELLYHRPSSDHDYILKDLRVVSTHADELKEYEIARLKEVIAYYFLNPYLEKGWQLNLPPQKVESGGAPASEKQDEQQNTQQGEKQSTPKDEQQSASVDKQTDFDALFTISRIPVSRPQETSRSS